MQALEYYQRDEKNGHMQDTINSFKTKIVGYMSPIKPPVSTRNRDGDRDWDCNGGWDGVSGNSNGYGFNGSSSNGSVNDDGGDDVGRVSDTTVDNPHTDESNSLLVYDTRYKEVLFSPATTPNSKHNYGYNTNTNINTLHQDLPSSPVLINDNDNDSYGGRFSHCGETTICMCNS